MKRKILRLVDEGYIIQLAIWNQRVDIYFQESWYIFLRKMLYLATRFAPHVLILIIAMVKKVVITLNCTYNCWNLAWNLYVCTYVGMIGLIVNVY